MNALVRLNSRTQPAYNHRLDDLFAGFFRPVLNESQGRGLDAIKLDVSEDDKAYLVTASLPGVKKDDIHVAVEKNEVTITAEVKREGEPKEGERVLHRERFFGKTARVFSVAQEIDDNAIQAKYTDGILSLTLPKKTPAAAKRVTIE